MLDMREGEESRWPEPRLVRSSRVLAEPLLRSPKLRARSNQSLQLGPIGSFVYKQIASAQLSSAIVLLARILKVSTLQSVIHAPTPTQQNFEARHISILLPHFNILES